MRPISFSQKKGGYQKIDLLRSVVNQHRDVLSRDNVCVSCAVSRHGKLYNKVVTRSHPSSTVLEKVLKKHISSNTALVTDGCLAYRLFIVSWSHVWRLQRRYYKVFQSLLGIL